MSMHLDITENITSDIKYQGIVTISAIDKKTGKEYKKKLYNKSEKDLFTAICRALCGVSVNDYIPRYLKAFTTDLIENKTLDTSYEAFYQPVYYSATPTLYALRNQKWVRSSLKEAQMIEYTFIIPSTNFKSDTETIKSLQLYNEQGNPCASITLDGGFTISSSSNILITWKLVFSNNSN